MNNYLVNLRQYLKSNPEQRFGQAAFNVCYLMDPEMADSLRGTHFDPFHNDDRVGEFLVEVGLKLESRLG